ncbi:hypothetical protein IG631_11962 [Alternaria alternata]|jgi:hypothetical protein|nr:hypothetical protein IG631_11962 [Alternaria alternata]
MAVKIHWSIKANYRNNHEREEGIELVVRLKGKDLPQHASTMYDSTNHDQSRFSAFPNLRPPGRSHPSCNSHHYTVALDAR